MTIVLGSVIIKNNTAFVIAEDGNGAEIVRKPKWTNLTNFELNGFNLNINYYGSHMDIDSKTYARKKMKSVTTADLFYSTTKGSLTMYAGIDNITDVDYERPDGYNQVNRNFTLGFNKKF